MTMTPDEWLADFQSKVADMQRQAASYKRQVESSGETVTSEDGKLSVTVAPNGVLLDLTIADDATVRGAEQAGKIMELVRAARERAATNAADSLRPLVGDHADSLDTESVTPSPAGKPQLRRDNDVDDEDDFTNESIFSNE